MRRGRWTHVGRSRVSMAAAMTEFSAASTIVKVASLYIVVNR